MLHRFTKDVCVEHAFEKAWWMRELMVCQILTVSLLVKSLLDIKTICEHLWTVSCSFHMEGSWKYDWRPPWQLPDAVVTNWYQSCFFWSPLLRRCAGGAEFHFFCIKQAPGLDTYLQDPMYSVQLIVSMLMTFGGSNWVTWLSCLNPQGDSGLVLYRALKRCFCLVPTWKSSPHDKIMGGLQWLHGYGSDDLHVFEFFLRHHVSIWYTTAVAKPRWSIDKNFLGFHWRLRLNTNNKRPSVTVLICMIFTYIYIYYIYIQELWSFWLRGQRCTGQWQSRSSKFYWKRCFCEFPCRTKCWSSNTLLPETPNSFWLRWHHLWISQIPSHLKS